MAGPGAAEVCGAPVAVPVGGFPVRGWPVAGPAVN